MAKKTTKKCKVCREEYTPAYSSMQQVCNKPHCILTLYKTSAAKTHRKQLNADKERIKSVSQWRKELQVLFNKYIRMRDSDKPCISCGGILKGTYHAGHFHSVGSSPNLRFNELNCHGQCVRCNVFLHGNLYFYGESLKQRIGTDQFNELNALKTQPLHLSVNEIRDLIAVYKSKIKCIQQK